MFPDENNNGMSIDMGENSNQVNAPKQNVVPEQPVQQNTQTQTQNKSSSISFDVNDLAKLVVDLQNKTNQQNAQTQAYEQAMRQSATINVAGKAVAEFEERMKKEIAEGNYVPIKYNNAMAKATGTRTPVSVNGYSMQFCRGATTAVPECLYDEVADTLDSGSLMRNNAETNECLVYDDMRKQLESTREKTTAQDALEAVTHHLTSKQY